MDDNKELDDNTIVRWTPLGGAPISILEEIADEFDLETEIEDAQASDAYIQPYDEGDDDSYSNNMSDDIGGGSGPRNFISFIGTKAEVDKAYIRFRELMIERINRL
ncbi:MAG: hypothetical protein GIS02_05670 [Methanosarcinales archaeon]|uniref:Uncharacterized protein n=1 Tax=Candidatus Ethanoperedens thermophilum TaxID=2766897 RepID=A0A848DAX8_9EURY|nr:hypothetical protein [Candidatus Ethanoperedens thermophilum]